MIILKAGRLAIVENDSKYGYGYATSGDTYFLAAGLMETTTLFTDMFAFGCKNGPEISSKTVNRQQTI